MSYKNVKISEVSTQLQERLKTLANKADILKAVELRALYAEIPTMDAGKRAEFGKEMNQLRSELEALVAASTETVEAVSPVDVASMHVLGCCRRSRAVVIRLWLSWSTYSIYSIGWVLLL
jgi:hypothetical protein